MVSLLGSQLESFSLVTSTLLPRLQVPPCRSVRPPCCISRLKNQPTFNPDLVAAPLHHDVVLLQRWSVSLHNFKRGDVVTLYSPQNPDLLTTKRIIALEGDLVTPLPPSGPTPVRIPAGHCWVEGDSRFNTRDSNTYGPVCDLPCLLRWH